MKIVIWKFYKFVLLTLSCVLIMHCLVIEQKPEAQKNVTVCDNTFYYPYIIRTQLCFRFTIQLFKDRRTAQFSRQDLKTRETTAFRTTYGDLTRKKKSTVHSVIGSSYSWAKLEEKKTLHTTKQVRHYGRNCNFLAKNSEAIFKVRFCHKVLMFLP